MRIAVIRQALGESWHELDPVVQQHYDIAPGHSAQRTIHGTMDEVYHSNLAKLLLIPGRLFGALVPYRGQLIPTLVRNWTCEANTRAMSWHRTLYFPNRLPLVFASRTEYENHHTIVEYVRFGLGIRLVLSEQGGALMFTSRGYVWKIGALKISLPGWLLLGEAVIVEKASGDNRFYIEFEMKHPLLGRTFAYSGQFFVARNREANSVVD